MKILLFISAAIILLASVGKIIVTGKRTGSLRSILPDAKKQLPVTDTFYAVRTIFQQSGKAAVKDTVVLIMHEIVLPKVKAGIKYSIEPIPYNPFDTVTPKKAYADTVVWTHKPYKPK